MPIDRKKYHPKWNLISYLVRFRRAKNRCEGCGILNYSVGYWQERVWHEPEQDRFVVDNLTTFQRAKAWRDAYNARIGSDYDWNTKRVCIVILTVSHLDHDIKHNRFWNLKALCQCCHLSHDRKDNAQKRMYGPTGRFSGQLKINFQDQPHY